MIAINKEKTYFLEEFWQGALQSRALDRISKNFKIRTFTLNHQVNHLHYKLNFAGWSL